MSVVLEHFSADYVRESQQCSAFNISNIKENAGIVKFFEFLSGPLSVIWIIRTLTLKPKKSVWDRGNNPKM